MGKVFLVGAGPGDPELLTVRALRVLQRANVVLHDALVSPEVLALISPGARVIDIGKRCGAKLLTQDEINALLISFAKTHATVVRLKGGDPGIFGRAGEEIDALVDSGVEFEIVPGITSAIAGAAAAGVSLTDRRFASSVVFATAHRGRGEGATAWDKLVTSGSTLAIYMPGSEYVELVTNLNRAGLAESTRCIAVSRAGRGDQQVLYTDLHGLKRSMPLPAPTLLIVGECARPSHVAAEVRGDYGNLASRRGRRAGRQDFGL